MSKDGWVSVFGMDISDVSPHGQEKSTVFEGTMSDGQVRKRVLESSAGLPFGPVGQVGVSWLF